MEHGLILHTAGRYEESNRVLLEAAALSRDLMTISATQEAAGFATTERIRTYRGEEFERVLIPTYLAMNFLLLGNDEEALVEAKRALQRLKDVKEPYEQHPFTRYLAGLCFELLGENEDAYLEYRKVQELGPPFPDLKRDLLRMAKALGRQEDEETWMKLPGPVPDATPGLSELVLFIQTGKGPLKESREIFIPPSHRFVIPAYRTRRSRAEPAIVRVGGAEVGRSCRLLDLNVVAVETLEGRKVQLGIKETLKKAAQEVIAQQTDEVWAEVLVRLAFFAMAGADVRCWETLPRDFQIARIPIAPGVYEVRLSFSSAGGDPVVERILPGVSVPARRPAFLNVRIFH